MIIRALTLLTLLTILFSVSSATAQDMMNTLLGPTSPTNLSNAMGDGRRQKVDPATVLANAVGARVNPNLAYDTTLSFPADHKLAPDYLRAVVLICGGNWCYKTATIDTVSGSVRKIEGSLYLPEIAEQIDAHRLSAPFTVQVKLAGKHFFSASRAVYEVSLARFIKTGASFDIKAGNATHGSIYIRPSK